jgi:nitrogen fixation NifU-like protein
VTREEIIDFLVEQARSQAHRGRLEGADIVVPGGNPGCGDVVTIHLKVDREGDRVAALSFEGEGCTISQAAAAILTEMVQAWPLTDIEAMDYNDMVDALGREVVQSRPRCATLALSTLKAAVRKYREARVRGDGEGQAGESPAPGVVGARGSTPEGSRSRQRR